LCQITKYIENKKIKNNKANEVPDLKGIDKAVWNFISAIYNSGWDSLIADKNNNFFRQKVSLNFTPKLNPVKTNNRCKENTEKSMSIKRQPHSISAKLPKEVNKISKFFKKNNLTNGNRDTRKLYAQVLSSSNNARKVLKIKEMFPNLQAKKIENIQKIIKDNGKPKLRINMTMKEPLRKQIIIPMSNDNKLKFMEESSAYVTNINKVLKNIKFKIIANFACSDQACITIVTNKVTLLLNL